MRVFKIYRISYSHYNPYYHTSNQQVYVIGFFLFETEEFRSTLLANNYMKLNISENSFRKLKFFANLFFKLDI